MEIILYPEHLVAKLQNEGVSNADLDELREDLSFFQLDVEFKEINLGTSVDWIVIMGVIIGLSNLFVLGDKIDKGIEGWIKIGRRLKSLIERKKIKYVDQDGVSLLAIEFISQLIEVKTLEKMNMITALYSDVISLESELSNFTLDKGYHYLSVHIYKINREEIFLLSIKSTGEVKLIERIKVTP